MQKLESYCDRCGAKIPTDAHYISLYFNIDTEMDASGNGYNDVHEPLDFCYVCLKSLTEALLQEFDRKEQKVLFDIWKKKIN